MQLKCWLLTIRILNLICAAMMIGFQIWYVIQLFCDDKGFFVIFIRIFTPLFIILLAVTIISAQFKFAKVVEHFKFLQFIPGLAFFNLFVASILAFQFSTLENHVYFLQYAGLQSQLRACFLPKPQRCVQCIALSQQALKVCFLLKNDSISLFAQQYLQMHYCCPTDQDIQEINKQTQKSKQSTSYTNSQFPNTSNIIEANYYQPFTQSQTKVNAFPNTQPPIRSQQLKKQRIEQLRKRNLTLKRQIQTRRSQLWQDTGRLYERSQQLKKVFIVKRSQLDGIISCINQFF